MSSYSEYHKSSYERKKAERSLNSNELTTIESCLTWALELTDIPDRMKPEIKKLIVKIKNTEKAKLYLFDDPVWHNVTGNGIIKLSLKVSNLAFKLAS